MFNRNAARLGAGIFSESPSVNVVVGSGSSFVSNVAETGGGFAYGGKLSKLVAVLANAAHNPAVNTAGAGSEVFLGSNRSDSSGTVHLWFKFRQPPGSYRIKYSLVAAGDASIPPVLTTLEVRRCMPGEVAPSPDACVACAAGSYSLHPANSSCDACPPGAACPGGSAISPLPGHWHSAATSSQVHR
ncbi:hypothetical protein OEZ85_007967 [Tetradesmus obliquus]|uniref:Uncharacterized protein n=1 Tax=Tetradesmus obliquus TaxID=3088 RepID=A0ABY8THI4_TETOB|nr:hypothetical protein OEZ85_007967 [Tetradesmus obliquus]